jgi:glycosyltransferase involved in cell wall biosynthesis
MVLIVGHLSEVKGYPTFLRAAVRVASAIEGCAFVALGGETVSGGYRAYLEGLAGELGIRERVHFLGWRQEVVEVLQAADVVVLPSLAEGMPLAVLEAMACARPVVATAVNGTPEAVVDNVTGFLIPPNDVDALAASIIRLLDAPELAANMGTAGRQRVERHFSLDQSLASVQALYDELLAQPRLTDRPSFRSTAWGRAGKRDATPALEHDVRDI